MLALREPEAIIVMRRTRLRAALLVVVSAALAGIGYLVSRNMIARRVRGLEALGKDFLPEVAQLCQKVVIINAGLNEGERVVTDGHYKLARNAPVTITTPASQPSGGAK